MPYIRLKATIIAILLALFGVTVEASSLLSGASLCTDMDCVVIRDVKRNGKLWKVGIRPGDVILRVDDQEIKTLDDYVRKSKSTNNKTATILFSSNGKEYTIVKKGNNYQRENIETEYFPGNTTTIPATDEGDNKTQANNQTSDVVDTSAETTETTELTMKEMYKRLAKIRKNVLRNSDRPTGDTSLDNSKTAPKVSKHPDEPEQDSTVTAESYFTIGSDHNKQVNYKDAIRAFKNAIRIRPDYAEAYVGIAFACINLEHWKNALDASNNATGIEPDNAEAYFLMGIAYDHLDQENKAIKAFEQAIRIKPDYMMAYLNIGLIYERQYLWDEAIAIYKQAVNIKPDYAQGYYRIGMAYYYHSRITKDHKTTIVFPRSNMGVFIRPNEFYIKHGYGTMAVEAFKQAISIKPDHALAHFALGIVYDEFGYTDLAFQEYEILTEVLWHYSLASEILDVNKWRQQYFMDKRQHEEDIRRKERIQHLKDKYGKPINK